MKSSNDSLSSADTMISVSKKPPRPPTPSTPPPPPPPPARQYDELDHTEIEIEVFDIEPHKYEPKSKAHSTSTQTQTHRKSVSFDLSDNEYIPVLAHDEPEPPDNIGELFLRQFSRENSHEDNDGYEVPIKYPSGPRSKPTKQVKSILRSPSPSSKAPTTPSSLDRPLITSYIQQPQPSTSVTTAIVHTVVAPTSDDEIERENPFRKEFLGRRAENIYEELDFDEQIPKRTVQITQIETKVKDTEQEKQKPSVTSLVKQRPKSAYESREYTEILTKSHPSNDNLSEKPESSLISTQSTSRSTGSLITDRPKQKPPLPPKPPSKPGSSVKSPSPVIKRADLKQNEALKTFQEEMLRGDLYEFVHDAETNQITRIKQQATNIPIATAKAAEPVARTETKEPPRLTTFNPSSPLPPIPKNTKTNTPPYSKVLKRGTSVERPTVSPPPPPVNLSTLPTSDKLKTLRTEDGSKVEILSTSTEELRKCHRDEYHENAPEYSLVTEETHREILLQENEIRNAMQQEQVVTETVTTTSRIPVRKAPLPPTVKTTATTTTTTTTNKHHKNTSISSDVISQEHSSATQSTSSQVFPVTQILPVQYSHLPTPQQPDYFLTFPSSPPQSSCNVMPMPQPGAFSTFMVSDNSAPQTTNIPTNIMCHPQQQLPMYLQRQYISVPISTTIHTINQTEHNLQGQNFINIHANGAGAQAPVLTTPSPSNNNSGPIFNVYRSNYNQQHQQQQQHQHHYHYQTQSLLPCQQDTHSSPLQSATLDSNPFRNDDFSTHATASATAGTANAAAPVGDVVDVNTRRTIGSSSFASMMTFVDSQFARNHNNENDNPVSSTTVQSSQSLTSISNSASNYHNISDEPEHTFTTFGKQTQV